MLIKVKDMKLFIPKLNVAWRPSFSVLELFNLEWNLLNKGWPCFVIVTKIGNPTISLADKLGRVRIVNHKALVSKMFYVHAV